MGRARSGPRWLMMWHKIRLIVALMAVLAPTFLLGLGCNLPCMAAQRHACCASSEEAAGIRAMPEMAPAATVVELSCGHESRVGSQDMACGLRVSASGMCGRATPRIDSSLEAASFVAAPGLEDVVWAVVTVAPLQSQAGEVRWCKRGYVGELRALPIAVLKSNLRV